MLTVIVPAFNEAENVSSLVAELAAASSTLPIHEVIYVDDGSTDATFEALCWNRPTIDFSASCVMGGAWGSPQPS